jgi:alkyl hydroperoxide reductase subunit AhpC
VWLLYPAPLIPHSIINQSMDWVFVHKTWDKWASSNIGSGKHARFMLSMNQFCRLLDW